MINTEETVNLVYRVNVIHHINEGGEIPGQPRCLWINPSPLASCAGQNPHPKHCAQPNGFACQPILVWLRAQSTSYQNKIEEKGVKK